MVQRGMTVIAWDGTTLAGDRLATYGGTKMRSRKVHLVTWKGKEWLIGGAGSLSITTAWLAWLQGKGDQPKIGDDDQFTGILIDRRHRIWQVHANLVPFRVPGKRHAIGSGRGEALGAMAMGADAKKAVMIAQAIDDSCGLGVDAVRFETHEELVRKTIKAGSKRFAPTLRRLAAV